MKKTYSKPKIVFESFELSTSIAGDCQIIITEDVYNDEASWGNFTDSNVCNKIGCYQVPGDMESLFFS